jgi:hypothetical protein
MNTSNDPQHKPVPDIGLSASPSSQDSQPAKPETETPEKPVVLSEPQRQALEWLNEENATVSDAAKFAGVSRTMFYKWVDTDPNFRALYTAWLRQQKRASDAPFFASELASVEAICEAARDRHDLSAARFIVKQAAARRQRQQRLQQQQERARERAQERAQRREDRLREQAQRREDRNTGLEGLNAGLQGLI